MKSETTIAVMSTDIKYIKKSIGEIKACLKDDYVKKTEFDPVKKIAYGLVSLVLVIVVSAIIGTVMIR